MNSTLTDAQLSAGMAYHKAAWEHLMFRPGNSVEDVRGYLAHQAHYRVLSDEQRSRLAKCEIGAMV